MSARRLKAYFYFLIATVLWGIASPVIKLTLTGIEPLPFLLYRFGISAGIGILMLTFVSRLRITSFRDAATIFIYSVFSTSLALGFLFLGLDKTTVLNLALITMAGPLLVELAGVVFLKERFTKREKIGTLVAIIGTLIAVVLPALQVNQGESRLEGNLLIAGYLFFDIAAIVILKIITRKKVDSLALINTSFVIGFLTLLPVVLIMYPYQELVGAISSLSIPHHLGVLYMAIGSGTLAYYFRTKGQKTIEISEAALFGYLVTVISVILAITFLGEQLTPNGLIGAITIIIGVILAEYKPK